MDTSRRPAAVIDIATTSDFQVAMSYPGLVVMETFAEWCGPCMPFEKEVLALIAHPDAKRPAVYFYRCPTKLVPLLRGDQQQVVDSCPHILFFKNGQLLHKLKGTLHSCPDTTHHICAQLRVVQHSIFLFHGSVPTMQGQTGLDCASWWAPWHQPFKNLRQLELTCFLAVTALNS